MSSSTTFIGAGFSLESIEQPALGMLQVKFTQDPVAVDSSGITDALNPDNYTITGPMVNPITSIAIVPDDTQSVLLTFESPFDTGTYTLTVANIISVDSFSLDTPTSDLFTVDALVVPGDPTGGTKNDDAAKVLRKHLPRVFKGKAWDALIAALAVGDQANWDNAKKAFDQLFLCSASGDYLVRRAADQGVSEPVNVGMPEEDFRKYAIAITNKKQITHVLWQILEAFYGSTAVRAWEDSTEFQPYIFTEGMALSVLVNERDSVNVVFRAQDFAQLSQAKAIEVAAVINRAFKLAGIKAFAVGETDPETGDKFVRLFSGAMGLGSSMRITGGSAQNILKFSEELDVYTGLPATVVV